MLLVRVQLSPKINMEKLLYKDANNRKSLKKTEENKRLFDALARANVLKNNNNIYPNKEAIRCKFKPYWIPRKEFNIYTIVCLGKSKKTKKKLYKSRCIMSSRGRGILREFKFSRIVARDLISYGKIEGWVKASW